MFVSVTDLSVNLLQGAVTFLICAFREWGLVNWSLVN